MSSAAWPSRRLPRGLSACDLQPVATEHARTPSTEKIETAARPVSWFMSPLPLNEDATPYSPRALLRHVPWSLVALRAGVALALAAGLIAGRLTDGRVLALFAIAF